MRAHFRRAVGNSWEIYPIIRLNISASAIARSRAVEDGQIMPRWVDVLTDALR